MKNFSHSCAHCGAASSLLYEMVCDYYFGSAGDWSIYQCDSIDCGAAFPWPRPSEEQLAAAYAIYYTHKNDSRSKFVSILKTFLAKISYMHLGNFKLSSRLSKLALIDMLIEDAILSSGAIIPVGTGIIGDVGCGNGQRLDLLRKIGWGRAVGVDPDPLAVEAGKQKGRDLICANAENLPWPDHYLDAAFMHHVIEHVNEPLAAMEEMFRVLKPGGRLVVITPNINSFNQSCHGKYWRGFEVPRHLTIFSINALSSFLLRAGFKVEMARSSARSDSWSSDESMRIKGDNSGEKFGRLGKFLKSCKIYREHSEQIARGHEIGDEIMIIARRKN